MITMFPEFNKFTEEDFKQIFDECTFVFDTNVLLNLYKYSPETKNELLEILDKIKDRIWMPYQVGLEYNFNRLPVIISQEQLYQEMIRDIESAADKFKNSISSKYNKKHPSIKWKEINDRLDNCIHGVISELKEKEANHPNWFTDDEVLKNLNELFEGRVGAKYEQSKLDEIYKEGEERYEKKVPPGYKDQKLKSGKTKEYDGLIYKDEYGDLVMWYQIIDYAIESEKPLIFITDDTKEDWWKGISGRTIGPRIELLNEMKVKAGVPFYMYRTDAFMKQIKVYLNEHVNYEAIQEVKELSDYYLIPTKSEESLKLYKNQVNDYHLEKYGSHYLEPKEKIHFVDYLNLINYENINGDKEGDYLFLREHENDLLYIPVKKDKLINEITNFVTEENRDYVIPQLNLILTSKNDEQEMIKSLEELKQRLYHLQLIAQIKKEREN